MSLGTLTISSNATDAQCLSFTVDGFLRVRGQGRFGSVVKIFTRLGMVTIDGRDLLWDAQAQAVLADGARCVPYIVPCRAPLFASALSRARKQWSAASLPEMLFP